MPGVDVVLERGTPRQRREVGPHMIATAEHRVRQGWSVVGVVPPDRLDTEIAVIHREGREQDDVPPLAHVRRDFARLVNVKGPFERRSASRGLQTYRAAADDRHPGATIGRRCADIMFRHIVEQC